jgi:hypothetical protein
MKYANFEQALQGVEEWLADAVRWNERGNQDCAAISCENIEDAARQAMEFANFENENKTVERE